MSFGRCNAEVVNVYTDDVFIKLLPGCVKSGGGKIKLVSYIYYYQFKIKVFIIKMVMFKTVSINLSIINLD